MNNIADKPQAQTGRSPDVPIRVVIIEDLREVRDGLAMLINGTSGFHCAGSYRTMEDALKGMAGTRPDVILTDIGLPGMDGVEGTRILRDRFPLIPVLALTVYDDDENVFNAICAGASGYLLKNTAPARLLESLREVVDGGAPMSPDVARRVRMGISTNTVSFHLKHIYEKLQVHSKTEAVAKALRERLI